MKTINFLLLLLFALSSNTLFAQLKLEYSKKNVRSARLPWVPSYECIAKDGICPNSLDYDEDGIPELVYFQKDGDNLDIIIAHPQIDSHPPYIIDLPQFSAADANKVAFLGFYDFDGNGQKEVLVSRLNSPQNGIDNGTLVIPGGEVIFVWDCRIIQVIKDWDNDGVQELILYNPEAREFEIWGQ